jgi:hypothetical protein
MLRACIRRQVFTGPLPSNVVAIHVTLFSHVWVCQMRLSCFMKIFLVFKIYAILPYNILGHFLDGANVAYTCTSSHGRLADAIDGRKSTKTGSKGVTPIRRFRSYNGGSGTQPSIVSFF